MERTCVNQSSTLAKSETDLVSLERPGIRDDAKKGGCSVLEQERTPLLLLPPIRVHSLPLARSLLYVCCK